MKSEILIPLALALDCLLGDPRGLVHPTRGMGRLAALIEARLRRVGASPRSALASGALAWLLVVGGSVLAGAALIEACAWALGLAAALSGAEPERWSAWGRGLASVYLVYAAMAPRDLAAHALRVRRALIVAPRAKQGDMAPSALSHSAGGAETEPREHGAPLSGNDAALRLQAGRRAVAMLVGRDVEALDEAGVCRAAIESVAESVVDGVCAPLLWAILLGPLGAVAYRAANTLDSLWGHKDGRYLFFGRVAARADDALNWPAARLGFAAAVLATALLSPVSRSRLDARAALRLGWRDRRKHESPNAAWLEASFSGALGLRLGGPLRYAGVLHEKPWLGEGAKPATPEDIRSAVLLMYATTIVFAGLALLAALPL